MRYSPEHKERTRRRIVREARRLFRRHGYDGVGVDAIMASADLTRGGFYGHFRSKAALFAEAMDGEHDFIERLRARDGRTLRELSEQALAVVAGYLAPENRTRVARGCSIAALSTDTARAGRRARGAYGAAVRDLAAELARGLPEPQHDDPRALASIALCVGGLLVSRAVGDAQLADRISAACRDAVSAQLSAE